MANPNQNPNKPKKQPQEREAPIRRETEQQGQDDPKPAKPPKQNEGANRPQQQRGQADSGGRQSAGADQREPFQP